jgi:hypothetical protein
MVLGRRLRCRLVIAALAVTLAAPIWPVAPTGAALPSAVEAILTAGTDRDQFGPAADLDGDTAVVGFQRRDDALGVVEQSVRVFRRTGMSWAPEATIPIPLPSPENPLADVAVDGDTLAASTVNGPTYVFVRSGTAWAQQAALSPADGAPGANFGSSVALDENTIVVGAPRTSYQSTPGAVYVFERTGTMWAETTKLVVPGDYLGGNYVAVDAGTLAVNSPYAVHVFVRQLGTWGLQASLDARGVQALALSGDTLFAGAPFTTARGSTWVYSRTGTSWTVQAQLKPTDLGVGVFGRAVAVDGDLAFIGANSAPEDGPGRLYAFKRSGTTWAGDTVPSPPEVPTRTVLGAGVAISGDTALASSGRIGVGPKPVLLYRLDVPASAPGAPTGVTATATTVSKALDVAWQAPASDGGALITGYTITASPGGATMSVPFLARSVRFTGLANGVPYTFTVTASNGVGAGPPSAPSNAAEARPVLTVGDGTTFEGDSGSVLVPLSLSLSDPSFRTVIVTLNSADGGAVAGQDYTAATRTITFPPGAVLAFPPVWAVHGDLTQEDDEGFRVDIRPTNATITRLSATVTIYDDDIPPEAVNQTVRIDVDPAGSPANDWRATSVFGSLDRSGRIVAFETRATNLVPGDTNGSLDDVFVRSLDGQQTTLASATPTGVSGNGGSFGFAPNELSADGTVLAFSTVATNLTGTPDTNNALDVVVRNLATRQTELVSVTPSGVAGNGASRDGAISPDGRYVLFWSGASDLVPGDTNGNVDVFVRDLVTDITERASLGPDGVQLNVDSLPIALSLDGRHVLFTTTNDSNLSTRYFGDWFLRDLVSGTTHILSAPLPADQHKQLFAQSSAFLSLTGRFVAFQSTDQVDDEKPSTSKGVWLFDNHTGTTRALTPTGDGVWRREFSTLIAMSRKGDVLFRSDDRYYVFHRRAGTIRALPDGLRPVAISPNGRVAIVSPPSASQIEDYSFLDLATFATAPLQSRGPSRLRPITWVLSNDGTHAEVRAVDDRNGENAYFVASTAAITVDDASGAEGGGTVPVTVRLVHPSGSVVKVHYATEHGTAGADDHTAVAGVLRFERGVTELTVHVPVTEDGVAEGDETFSVVLSSPVRGIIRDDRAVVTIRDG